MIRPMASARMISVMVWLPELPPMPATIDIKKARITMWLTVPSNRDATKDAVAAVQRLSSSQGARLRSAVVTGAKMSSSCRPARDSACSWESSRITSTTSAMVTRPIRRPWSSITGAETRS
ncbi:hypothetical protein D3C78_1607960 [compost metagenome]